MRITGTQIQIAMMKAKIRSVVHYTCPVCGFTVGYFRNDATLFHNVFCVCDIGSYCTEDDLLESWETSWETIARHMNRELDLDRKKKLAHSFGLHLDLTASADFVYSGDKSRWIS